MRQDLNFKNFYPSSKFKKGTKPLIFKLIDTLKMKIKVLKELSFLFMGKRITLEGTHI